MNISSLFARSYVDAISIAAGSLAAKAPARQPDRKAERRRSETLSAAIAAKKIAVSREALDARW